MKVVVSDFTEVEIRPKAGGFPHLVAKQNIQTMCRLHLHDCNNAQANALRRTLACELPVISLTCDYMDIVCDDLHVIGEMVQKRIMMIPINQRMPVPALSLTAHNTTMQPMDVKAVFVDKNGKTYNGNNHTITLLTLQPGRKIKISNIHTTTGYGYNEGCGMQTLTYQCTSICTDVEPLNTFEGTGVSTHEAAPREWDIGFGTNGTLPGKECVKLACAELCKRLDRVLTLMSRVRSDENRYTLDIPNESDTIGNLIVAAAVEMFPSLQSAVYSVPTTERICTLRIAYDDDINMFFQAIVEREQAFFQALSAQI
jgi:DNA-directed RNA polymerase subunit L